MAWTSYELNDALAICKELSEGVDQRSFYSGIFMGNVVGGLSGSMGHVPEYLPMILISRATLLMPSM